MKLSIIIPLYNNENTLGRCLESVLSQDIDDCEIIIVDDGSTDNSGLLADEWERNDKRISVIHKQNGGTSEAKNYGLDVVKGEYPNWTFLDTNNSAEINRRKRVVGRFIFYYNKFSRV